MNTKKLKVDSPLVCADLHASFLCCFSAWALRCHQCQPDYAKIASNVQNLNNSGGGLTLCSKPTDSFDCSQDPNIGLFADACSTTSVTMNTSFVGEIKFYVLNCTMKLACPMAKNMTCSVLQSIFPGIPGFDVSACDVNCCEGDLCNNPSGSTPVATSKPPSGPTSSAKSIGIPPNGAIFGMLGLIAVAFMNLF